MIRMTLASVTPPIKLPRADEFVRRVGMQRIKKKARIFCEGHKLIVSTVSGAFTSPGRKVPKAPAPFASLHTYQDHASGKADKEEGQVGVRRFRRLSGAAVPSVFFIEIPAVLGCAQRIRHGVGGVPDLDMAVSSSA
jgi:hypothetical protein